LNIKEAPEAGLTLLTILEAGPCKGLSRGFNWFQRLRRQPSPYFAVIRRQPRMPTNDMYKDLDHEVSMLPKTSSKIRWPTLEKQIMATKGCLLTVVSSPASIDLC
jgi:hypothetical protein